MNIANEGPVKVV